MVETFAKAKGPRFRCSFVKKWLFHNDKRAVSGESKWFFPELGGEKAQINKFYKFWLTWSREKCCLARGATGGRLVAAGRAATSLLVG